MTTPTEPTPCCPCAGCSAKRFQRLINWIDTRYTEANLGEILLITNMAISICFDNPDLSEIAIAHIDIQRAKRRARNLEKAYREKTASANA